MFLKNLIEAGSSGIENIMTDVLDLGDCKYNDISAKITPVR